MKYVRIQGERLGNPGGQEDEHEPELCKGF